jgi:hypothetical protein
MMRGLRALGLLPVLALSGCQIFGYAAQTLPKLPVAAAYKGLAGQSVGVMVWVERGVRIDYPTIQLDIANAVQNNLVEAQKAKKEDLKDTTFPVEPRSIARYQAEHPESEALPITSVAPNLNVSRLIYIEVTDFHTRPEASLELYRGFVVGNVRVVEVDGAGNAGWVARVVYQQSNLQFTFPVKSPPEGILGSSDIRMYEGSLEGFTTRVAQLFFTHHPPEE